MKRVILAAALAFLAMAANAAEDTQSPPTPPTTAPQQATAPVAAVVVVHCGKIVAVAVTDTTGDLHPLDVDAVSDATLKNILAHIPRQLVANIQCKVGNQRSTTL